MKTLGVIVFLILSFVFFFRVSEQNYQVHKDIKLQVVHHPEFLPDATTAEISSVWYKNVVADVYWLKAIQYIGGNAIQAEYKKYLYSMLDLITDLNPYFESPYIIGELLLPDYNFRYEDRSEEEQQKNIQEWEALWLKWVENFCDQEKVGDIFAEDNLKKLWETESLKNPCKSYSIPYYLAYIYFFYQNDPATASQYYKLTSMQDDAPEWAKILTAIMQGKWWDREKALFMFLSLAESVESDTTACKVMTHELQQVYLWLRSGDIPLDGNLVQAVEQKRDDIFPKFNEENESQVFDERKCTNYLHKAIRELNLLYIEWGNAQFEKNHPDGLPARNAQALYQEGYINFLPTDYQQYEDQWIIYQYNYDLKRYDYEMGRY